ncbi:MAG: hypothetical protein MPF33_10240 [Candidatus Aramenus sp.]|nr:hypothetical protein [Candidatus Aramenus sp.]
MDVVKTNVKLKNSSGGVLGCIPLTPHGPAGI